MRPGRPLRWRAGGTGRRLSLIHICYTGYDVSGLEVELAPGESRVLYWGSRGKGYANRIPAADCVMADWLEAVYTDSQGNEVPIPLEREVHLD